MTNVVMPQGYHGLHAVCKGFAGRLCRADRPRCTRIAQPLMSPRFYLYVTGSRNAINFSVYVSATGR
jgi:hypothetical protein